MPTDREPLGITLTAFDRMVAEARRDERERVLAELTAGLAELELHDDLLDSHDIGYMGCWRDVQQLVASVLGSEEGANKSAENLGQDGAESSSVGSPVPSGDEREAASAEFEWWCWYCGSTSPDEGGLASATCARRHGPVTLQRRRVAPGGGSQ
jgi:hypothetical protein